MFRFVKLETNATAMRRYTWFGIKWILLVTGAVLVVCFLEGYLGICAIMLRSDMTSDTSYNASIKMLKTSFHFEYVDTTTPTNVLSNNITVVSAYFDLGAFQKGASGRHFQSTDTYEAWGKVFSCMENHLVFYTDSHKYASLMRSIRQGLENKTIIRTIRRNSSWAFRREKTIAKIYHRSGYPKHHPNTVVPAYACAQHAKYDVVARAARANHFNTRYFAWIDVGYFRNRSPHGKHFIILTPKDYNESNIAMNLMFPHSMMLKPAFIFKKNLVWVGGGLFLGRIDVVIRYEKQYKTAVDYFLSNSLMNTDQQVIFAMFSNEGRSALKPDIDLQLYHGNSEDWFYLGFSMLHEV